MKTRSLASLFVLVLYTHAFTLQVSWPWSLPSSSSSSTLAPSARRYADPWFHLLRARECESPVLLVRWDGMADAFWRSTRSIHIRSRFSILENAYGSFLFPPSLYLFYLYPTPLARLQQTESLDSYAHKPDCFKRAAGRIRSFCGDLDSEGMDEDERTRGKNLLVFLVWPVVKHLHISLISTPISTMPCTDSCDNDDPVRTEHSLPTSPT